MQEQWPREIRSSAPPYADRRWGCILLLDSRYTLLGCHGVLMMNDDDYDDDGDKDDDDVDDVTADADQCHEPALHQQPCSVPREIGA